MILLHIKITEMYCPIDHAQILLARILLSLCILTVLRFLEGRIYIAYNFIVRIGGGVAQKVVASGLRCIVSNQDKWYLDHLDATWQQFYMNEPLTNITNPNQQVLVIGGEVCMWGEYIDGSDIEQTIWPRAAAAAGNYYFFTVKLNSWYVMFLRPQIYERDTGDSRLNNQERTYYLRYAGNIFCIMTVSSV